MAVVSYLGGWYDEEHAGARPFRWTGREAHCHLRDVPASCCVRLTAGHAFPGQSTRLSVFLGDRLVGQREVGAHYRSYVFAVPQDATPSQPSNSASEFDLRLAVDEPFRVPGDPRALGVMVSSVEILDLDAVAEPVDGEGWYDWERGEYFPHRWMAGEAEIFLPSGFWRGARFASLPVSSDIEDGTQTLTIVDDGTTLAELPLLPRWHLYDVALPARLAEDPQAGRRIVLRVNGLLPLERHPSDPRELSVRVGAIELHDDARRHEKVRMFHEAWRSGGAPDSRVVDELEGQDDSYFPEHRDGWYGREFEEKVRFRWMKRDAVLTVPAAVHRGRRFCLAPVYTEYRDLSQVLTISAGGRPLAEQRLLFGWHSYTFALPGGAADAGLAFHVNKCAPVPDNDEPRGELGVRIGALGFYDDEQLYDGLRFRSDNAILRQHEISSGATVLESFPETLGIDLFGKCNIKPPCVYCLWDRAKGSEGEDTNVVVDDGTLEGYGKFFDAAESLVNCSFGEPLLHPRLGEVLDLFRRARKAGELATNGQSFTPAAVRTLTGANVRLYVSLDSASAETYARLRNDRWWEVVTGLTFLREARRAANGFPKVYLVFMPMRANLHDLEAFFKLCRMVNADALVLRPLNHMQEANLVTDRGGYHFDYGRELLSWPELEAVFQQSDGYAAKYGVRVISQFDFQSVRREKRKAGRRDA